MENTLTLDRVNKYFVVAKNNPIRGNIKRTKHRWYKRRTRVAEMKIKRYAAFLFDLAKELKKPVYMITITTKQHEKKNDDKYYTEVLRNWFKNNDSFRYYICVAERQNLTTNDIHFHILVILESKISIPNSISYFAKRFNIKQHPAIFELTKCNNKAADYIAKYMSKDSKFPCADIFTSRSWSASRTLTSLYKNYADRYIIKFDCTTEFYLKNKHLFVEKYRHDYVILYKYFPNLWHEFKKHRIKFPAPCS